MLSIAARTDAKSAASYYIHLSHGDAARDVEDYYSAEAPGYYVGHGAGALMLEGRIEPHAFHELAQGRTPIGHVRNAGTEARRAGWDLTFSAPKTVSVLWATANEDARVEIERAHDEAVGDAFRFMEDHAGFTRRGSGSRLTDEQRREHVGLVGGCYRHGTSREGDPQLHSHLMLFNIAVRPDGTVGAIDPRPLYQWKMAGGAVYRAALAQRLQELGYGLDADAKKRSFRVSAVDLELEAEFSRRRQQIEQALRGRGATGARASEIAALDTRRTKQKLSREALLADWQRRVLEIAPRFHFEQAKRHGDRQVEMPVDVKQVQAEMTRQNSTVSEAQLYAAVAQVRQLAGGREAVERAVETVRQDGDTVPLDAAGQARYTTTEMQRTERRLVAHAERLNERSGHTVAEMRLSASLERRTLTNEQLRAAKYIIQVGDIALIQGMAGTGKSYLLGAAKHAWEGAGYRVRGVALSGKAAQELYSGSTIESSTLKRFEMDIRGWTDEQGETHESTDGLTARDVVVVDEAGMIGSKQMEALLKDICESHAKIVLVGDTRQLQSIEAGAAFRAIQDRRGYATLDHIRRQNSIEDRRAVQDLAAGRAEAALESLSKRGRLHVGESARDAKRAVGWAVADDLAAGKLSLGLTGTRVEARDVNEAARERARDRGLIHGDDVAIASSQGSRHFAAGDRILFTRNNRDLDVKNGDLATVRQIGDDEVGGVRMAVDLDRGGTVDFNIRHYDHVEHGYGVTVHKSQGTTLDKAHVLAADSAMASREWAYVAASRSREETHVYADRYTLNELAPTWSRPRQKDVTLDYVHRAEYVQEVR